MKKTRYLLISIITAFSMAILVTIYPKLMETFNFYQRVVISFFWILLSNLAGYIITRGIEK